jgi:transposase
MGTRVTWIDSRERCRIAFARPLRASCLLFLPPYSPDLNPIEQMFAKLKHLMRKSQPETSKQRTFINLLSPSECANYLQIRFRLKESRSNQNMISPHSANGRLSLFANF